MGGPVGLEKSDGGDEAECSHDYAERTEDYEPGSGAAFGENIVVAGAGDC